jgi:predicted dehydrogenase
LENVVIIGAGAIARAHARGALRGGEAVAIGVTDPSAEAIELFIGEFPEARVFDSLRDMLGSPVGKDDIVINATPPYCHMEPSASRLLQHETSRFAGRGTGAQTHAGWRAG